MPQLHLYLSQAQADEVRRRAELRGLSTSAFLAEVVKAQIDDCWPEGYLEEVIGATAEFPLERPAPRKFLTFAMPSSELSPGYQFLHRSPEPHKSCPG
jgi:hypothetical protein